MTTLLGLDVGSTTVKAVAVRGETIVSRWYRRHRGRAIDEALSLVDAAREEASPGRVIVTGSAGAAVAQRLGAELVHEVHAVAAAARRAVPGVRTIVELGGQDAKMVHLEPGSGLVTEMNERCAAGTGTVIDRCAFRLGLAEEALAALEQPGEALPAVSARCGVFAEADVVALVKAGGSPVEAMLALLDAIVRQNLVALARGRPLVGPVCLLGGPNAFIPSLVRAWERHLRARWLEHGVTPAEIVVPRDAQLFAALGAAQSIGEIDRLASARGRRASLFVAPAPARAATTGAALGTCELPRPPAPRRCTAGEEVFVGLDAGSTTVKAVALGAQGEVLGRAYRHAGGNVFDDSAAVLGELGARLGSAAIRGLGVTGYAGDLLAPVLEADCSVVETLAHARSARRFVPDADVVCDVGGQDIKVLMLDEAGVRDFRLSHQCAAGNGALLEATAAALGVPLEQVATVTSGARQVPRFSVGCAVFLDTERVTAQRDGLSPADILAGMTSVLPRNVWENVVAAPSLESLGDVFVLSGGVQRNAAAVRAQADYIASRHPGARVIVHPYAGEAGAIGAALAAREAVGGRPRRARSFELARGLKVTATSSEATRCRLCPSHCARTLVAAERNGAVRSLVTGNACERGAALPGATRASRTTTKRGVNLVRLEATRLFRRHHDVRVVTHAARGLRVAIPRVLAAYRAAPLFTHYFEALGVAREHLVTGELTSEALWRRAAGRGTAEACFPAKVAQAHVADLLARREREPFDVLFFPAVTHAVTAITGCADTASCPVVAGTPLVTRVAFGADIDGVLPNGVKLLTPALVLPRKRALSEALFESIRSVLPALRRDEHDAALAEAITAQKKWDRQLEEVGTALLRDTSRARRCAVVMIGRPYHADPGLHHELSSELAALGRSVMTLRSLPHSADMLAAAGCRSPHDLSDLPFLTNSGDGERLAAARFVGDHPWLVAIELSAFKCGQDASLYSHVAEAARGKSGKPFLALHDLDETRPVASLRLRLRTFLDAVEQWEQRASRTTLRREATA